MPRVLPAVALLAFTIYALVDCVQSRDEDIRGIPKLAWLIVILIAPLVGGIGWFIAGRPIGVSWAQGLGDRGTGLPRREPPGRPQAPRGPDDDPDFLRNL